MRASGDSLFLVILVAVCGIAAADSLNIARPVGSIGDVFGSAIDPSFSFMLGVDVALPSLR